MPDSDLANLRRARVRVHGQLNKLEPLVEGYRAKLTDLEARIKQSRLSCSSSPGATSGTPCSPGAR